MEPHEGSFHEPQEVNDPGSTGTIHVYPPPYEKEDRTTNAWLRSLVSLAAYLLLGFYIFKRWEMLLLITAIVIFHELGHFFAMKYFRYNDLGIFFIPLLGAYVSGSKREVSQKESAIILLAGPLPGIILGIIFYLLWQQNPALHIGRESFRTVSFLLIILNLLNLLPVYPLDGGQLLNRVYFNEESWLSKIFIFLSVAFLVWISVKFRVYILLIFPLYMIVRMLGDRKSGHIEKQIESEGINTDVAYEDLPAEDYWKIRNILIASHPSLKDVAPSPPYEYSPREEKIMTMIRNLLNRHLIQDVSIAGKVLILIIWIAALAAPWLLSMEMYFLEGLSR